MWWGYEHTQGTYHVKRYYSAEDIHEAQQSPFCKQVVGPFPAEGREEAIYMTKTLCTACNTSEPTDAEVQLYYCMKGTGGSFSTSLFQTIMRADIHNQAKLAKGFPEEVEVALKYMNQPGYWENLQQRIQNSK